MKAVPIPGPRERRVVFVGDSYVAGVGDPTGLGWVGRAVAEAFAADLPLSHSNLGIRGQTSAGLAEGWVVEATPRLHAEADNRLVVGIGANDTLLLDGRPRVTARDSVAHLGDVLASAKRLELPAFVVGPPPVGGTKQRERIAGLDRRLATVAVEHHVPYVSVHVGLWEGHAWGDEAAAGDGAHPAAEGYAQLAALVREPWLDWLAPGSASAPA